MFVALVAAAHAAAVSMAGLHVQGNALVNGDGVGVLIHVRASLLLPSLDRSTQGVDYSGTEYACAQGLLPSATWLWC